MLVNNALGISRSAAGVTKTARFALVTFVPRVVAILRRQPVVELVVEAHVVLNGRPARLHPRDQAFEGCIVEQHTVLGVRGNVGKLIIEQAGIERVKDAAHANHPEPGREVPVVVHRQRGNALSRPDAKTLQRLPHAASVIGKRLPVSSHGRPVRPRCDDFACAVLSLGMVQQPHDAERKILHCAERAHQRLP